MADTAPQEQLASPPIQEMALGVVFNPLEKLTGPFVGLFWLPIQREYPKFHSRPTFPAQIETFGDPFSQRQQVPVVVNFQQIGPTGTTSIGEVPQRHIFSDDEGSRVIQIQRDLLTRSWVRKSASARYPEYNPALRGEFEREWARLSGFARDNGMGEIRAKQCEATYVNMIPRGEGWQSFADFPQIIAPWSGRTELEMPAPDAVHFQASYPLHTAHGRVVISVGPAKRAWDDADAISLTISSRVIAGGADQAEVMRCLDAAHDAARMAFRAFASRRIFDQWRGGQ